MTGRSQSSGLLFSTMLHHSLWFFSNYLAFQNTKFHHLEKVGCLKGRFPLGFLGNSQLGCDRSSRHQCKCPSGLIFCTCCKGDIPSIWFLSFCSVCMRPRLFFSWHFAAPFADPCWRHLTPNACLMRCENGTHLMFNCSSTFPLCPLKHNFLFASEPTPRTPH